MKDIKIIEKESPKCETLEEILLDVYHHIENIGDAKTRIQISLMRQMDDLYSRGHQPDDIPAEASAYNEGVHECINILNTL